MIDFLCIGPTRTGTTWLHDRLSGSVSLPGPYVKETKFFDMNFKRGTAWYESHMENVSNAPRGEFGPTYFHSHLARKRVAQLAPGCTIIAILREPVERLFSLYRMMVAFGTIRGSFEDALFLNEECLSSTRYAFNLAAWALAFPGQVHVLFYDSLLIDSRRFIGDFCQLCGVATPKFDDKALQERINDSARWRVPKFPLVTHLSAELAWSLRFRKFSMFSRAKRRLRISRRSLTFGKPLPKITSMLAAQARSLLNGEIDALERLLGIELEAWRKGLVMHSYIEPIVIPSRTMVTAHLATSRDSAQMA